jgi:Sortilin, neurotensin receptor 3,/Sortilin, neurotensin receptor 3, C-terminal
VISDNFFQKEDSQIQEFEPDLEPGRTVTGIVNMRVVQKYLVAATSSSNTDEMALYVSDNTIKWHRAIFPHDHKLVEEAYTLLESTSYSIQIDVMTSRPSNPMGVLFSSNSNGTYFTRNIEHTNRNRRGIVDFEKVAGVQGIIVANTVKNWEEVEEKYNSVKKAVSSISFDDGRTWQNLKIKDEDERLHLHLVTEMANIGRVLSSPAPGLLMGVGNTGEHLKDFMEGDTYVSDDGGMAWTKALTGPHKYEFGDKGSVLVAIEIGGTNVIRYSLDHGTSWPKVELGVDNLEADILTTTSDSTSLKFLLTGGKLGEDNSAEYYVMSINFEEMHERKCEEKDIETWYARVDADGKPTCLMGHEQSYRRRRKAADCFMKEEFQAPVPKFPRCPCTDADFECDFNFVRDEEDRTKCILKGTLVIPEGQCKDFDEETTFKGSSGWRLIPGNECILADGIQKDALIDRKCSESATTPASGKITHSEYVFPGSSIHQKIYLERTESSTGDDETIVARMGAQVFISRDHGKTWDEVDKLKNVKVEYMIRHKYFNDVIYFLTASKEVYYSINRGDNIRKFSSGVPTYMHPSYNPMSFNPSYNPMSFHPKHKDWIIWVGVEDRNCLSDSTGKDSDCNAIASVTEDRGDNWKTIRRYADKCVFVDDFAGQWRQDQDKRIYCMSRKEESSTSTNNPWQLVSSNDFFEGDITTHLDYLIDFATESEFVVAATKKDGEDLKASTSVDGSTFADALFPPNFKAPEHRSAYTVLDSSTRALFMSVMVGAERDYKYGTIMKSNSNGTSYVLSLNAANQDNDGYVDFEKMYGIEGTALANIVANSETAVSDNGKKLKTVITHNDGADWAPLSPPEGKKFDCTSPSDQCSFHIHGYTERSDYSHTYSSKSAIGIMFGVGNVGEYLGDRKDADTFITTDAGISWKLAREGTHMWEFGDQGSILVLVKDSEPTNVVHYSLNEGSTWTGYPFSSEDEKYLIVDLTTVPSDNSRNFVLWAKTSKGMSAINLDFSGLSDRQCTLDETGQGDSDYYPWTPKHPIQGECLFGHVAQYHRKKPDSECYNGRMIDRLHNIARNCLCIRQDFEWWV